MTPPALGVLEPSLDASNFGPDTSLQEMHFYAQVFKMKAREESMQFCKPMYYICIYYILYI